MGGKTESTGQRERAWELAKNRWTETDRQTDRRIESWTEERNGNRHLKRERDREIDRQRWID